MVIEITGGGRMQTPTKVSSMSSSELSSSLQMSSESCKTRHMSLVNIFVKSKDNRINEDYINRDYFYHMQVTKQIK